jgi:hypothetical protein
LIIGKRRYHGLLREALAGLPDVSDAPHQGERDATDSHGWPSTTHRCRQPRTVMLTSAPFTAEQCDETKPSCNQWYVVWCIPSPASLDQHPYPAILTLAMKRQIQTAVSRIQGRVRPHVPQRNPSDGKARPTSQQKDLVGGGGKETRDCRSRIQYLGSPPTSAHHHHHHHHHHHPPQVPL